MLEINIYFNDNINLVTLLRILLSVKNFNIFTLRMRCRSVRSEEFEKVSQLLSSAFDIVNNQKSL